MLSSLKTLIASKKFLLVLLGSAVVGGMQYLGVPQDIIVVVGGFFGVNILGIGMQDMGKEKAKIEAKP